jgi:hypothetical protein
MALTGVYAQNIHLKEITNLMDLTQSRLETHIQKKGFEKTYLYTDKDISFSLVRFDQQPTANIIRCFQILPNAGGFDLVYQTTCPEEYASLKTEMNASGFDPSTKNNASVIYYQKQNLELTCLTKKVDTSTFYSLRASRKKLPKARDIQFAEDLLQYDSHSYLVAAFGKEHVKKDSFYFSKNEKAACSVLFPNSSRQAIFVWNDQDNFRQLSFILFGEQPGRRSTNNVDQVTLSSWRSKQGIYCGMSLKELQLINQRPVQLYNWRSDHAGYVAPGNKGQIDFEKINLRFDCLNCGYQSIAGHADIINSDEALSADQKVYITTYYVLPDKKM